MSDFFDAAVVLGAKIEADGRPSPALLRRITHAAGLYHAGRVPFLLLSGGQAKGGVSEAEAMRRALLALDVPETVLRLEELSRNTLENALFSRPIIQRQGWRRLLLVTDGYHMPRALYTFRRLGMRAKGHAAPRPDWSLKLAATHGREWVGLAFYVWKIERALRGYLT